MDRKSSLAIDYFNYYKLDKNLGVQESIMETYNKLNRKCDAILQRIRRRKEKQTI